VLPLIIRQSDTTGWLTYEVFELDGGMNLGYMEQLERDQFLRHNRLFNRRHWLGRNHFDSSSLLILHNLLYNGQQIRSSSSKVSIQ
jgi:hypothetical protein